MRNNGYLYVLINESMAGMVKVGKTTRDPADRAQELSSATGVPTPFVLVYHTAVVDCHFAEQWVHSQLELGGYRIARNREFFNVPIAQAIDLLLASKEMLGPEPLSIMNDAENEGDDIAEELFELANVYADGGDDVIKNSEKALALYEQAAAMGHKFACVSAAQMLLMQESGGNAFEKALSYYQRAISEHSMKEMNADVATLFLRVKQPKSAENAWRKFFEAARLDSQNIARYGGFVINYCLHVIEGKIVEVVPRSELFAMKDSATEVLDQLVAMNHPHWVAHRSRIVAMLTSSSDASA